MTKESIFDICRWRAT